MSLALTVEKLLAPVARMVGPWFRKTTNDKLALYGLRYDDLHDPLKDEEVAEALRRLPPDVLAARNARLRRAIDLDMKHDHLHGEMLAKQTPGESYLQELLEEVRAERRERAMLGAKATYTRIYT
ncbi:ubiquinol:cytochrome c oxidoreductase 14 kDa subunit [Haematococcus lacustris]